MKRRNQPPARLPEAVRDHPEVIAACRARDVGKLFRVVQNLTEEPNKFTNSHLARRCELTVAQVADYMCGRREVEHFAVLERIADGLGIPGYRLGIGRRPWEPRPVRPGSVSQGSDAAGSTLTDSMSDINVARLGTVEALSALLEWPMRRRRFLAASGAALIIPAHEWLLDPGPLKAAANGRPVSPEAMDELERIIDQQSVLSDRIGIDAALPGLRGLLGTVVSLIKRNSYSQAVGTRLYSSASTVSRTIGWLNYENDDPDAARHYMVAALKAAHAAGDRQLGAYTLARLANVENAFGDPRHAVIMLQTAQTGTPHVLVARQQADIWAMLAMSYGRLHDVDATRRAADTAAALIADARGDGDPGYLAWIDSAEVTSMSGRAFIHAGAHADSRAYLEAAIAKLHATLPRDRARHQLHLASVLIASGEVEQACAYAQQGTDILDRLGGARVTSFARDFATNLAAYRANPTAAAYLDRNHDLLVAT
jgi:hypothetical protein